MIEKAYFKSQAGVLEICANENGVCEINFVKNFIKTQIKDENLKLCLCELDGYFKGKLKKFTTKIDIKASKFAKSVYNELLNIPYGQTATYAQVAKAIKKDKAFRAVGNANAKNKIPIIVPCHRVVSSNGLGGYSGGNGLETKLFLLNLERKYCES